MDFKCDELIFGKKDADLGALTVKDSPSISISLDRLLSAIAKPLIFEQMELTLSASVGAASAPDDGLDPDLLLEKADQAMYLMKRNGKKTTCTDYLPPDSYTL